MKRNPSRKHHFVPVHYQKLFVNEKGGYYIFDIKKNQFKQDGRIFYPDSHFYEINENTFEFHGLPPLRLEEIYYSPYDMYIGKTIKYVVSNYSNGNLTGDDINFINYFFGQLIWRNPDSVRDIKMLLDSFPLSKLGFPIKNSVTGEVVENSEFERRIKIDPNGYKLLRALIPFPLSISSGEHYQNFTISKVFGNNLPGIIGDIPYIMLSSNIAKAFIDSAILPLGKDLYAIRMNNLSTEISSKVKILIDLIILKQAQNYVAVSDIDYIDYLKNSLYYTKSLQDCKNTLFVYLELAK